MDSVSLNSKSFCSYSNYLRPVTALNRERERERERENSFYSVQDLSINNSFVFHTRLSFHYVCTRTKWLLRLFSSIGRSNLNVCVHSCKVFICKPLWMCSTSCAYKHIIMRFGTCEPQTALPFFRLFLKLRLEFKTQSNGTTS